MSKNRFILKGIIRDKRRSLLPVIVVAIGVMFVVFLDGFIGGMLGNMTKMTAIHDTGHLKVMTSAYNLEKDQIPAEYALLGTDDLITVLKEEYPSIDWTPRIIFGGLLDIPDQNGETKAQGPVRGTAYDLLSPQSKEAERIGLHKAIVDGGLIIQSGEILISDDFSKSYDVHPGDEVTFFGSTMYGSMSFMNYKVAGVVKFGIAVIDKGSIILDIEDARLLMDMENAANEILGFLPGDKYDREEAERIKQDFNSKYSDKSDEFSPIMLQLADQNMMSQTLSYVDSLTLFLMFLVILALSIVLWNTGLLSGIRRYNEFGIRIALGENKVAIYRSLLTESFMIGIIGSVLGTCIALLICLYLNKYGIDYGSIVENMNLMVDPVIRADIKPSMFWIGFIPGVISMLIGTALSGRAIFKRNTASLFNGDGGK